MRTKKGMLACGLLTAFVCCVMEVQAGVALSNVKVQQRYPWNGKVDIWFNIAGTRQNNSVIIRALDTETGRTLDVRSLYDDNGQLILPPIKMGTGKHHIVWNADEDVEAGFKTESLAVTVSAGKYYDHPLYCVVDISGGPTAAHYPVTYLDGVPDGGWTEEYKTQKIVLRLIQPGRFIEGPNDGNTWFADNSFREVTLTKPFYMAIFETTQAQWKNVTGTSSGGTGMDDSKSDRFGNTRPQRVWLSTVRGNDANMAWPTSREVDEGTFMYLLRQKTAMNGFEIPTEAQWEYACRAGTSDNEVHQSSNGYYGHEHSQEIILNEVGSEAPNAWGLYDMLGNAGEWTIDKCEVSYGYAPVVDPKGPLDVTGIGTGPYYANSIIMRCLRGREIPGAKVFAAKARAMWYDDSKYSINDLAAGFRIILQLEH